MAAPWPYMVQCLVARATGDQGLAAIRDHPLDPQGFFLAAWLVQVSKPADVMHVPWPLHPALPVSAEGHPAKPGAQRRGAFSAFVVHRPPPQWALRRGDGGPIVVQEFADARPMLVRQRLGQR
jgi:hypothetical protein